MKGHGEAYCKVCKSCLRAQHCDLVVHSKTKKHQEKMKSLNRSQQADVRSFGRYMALFLFYYIILLAFPIPYCFTFSSGVTISDQSKVLDLRLAVFVAMHCSIKSTDHLCELLKAIAPASFNKFTLHRTKCSSLIANVIAPAFVDELVQDIGTWQYAIIADESTDISVSKYLALCVRYFSQSKKKFVTEILGLIQVPSCTAENLVKVFKQYLRDIKLEIKQMRAVGTDGASNMCGVRTSFFALLKEEILELELFKCTCHSPDKSAE